MAVLLYARVSTPDQAERDLSIPAQLRALRKLARDQGLEILGEYQDVASGRNFRNRPGLMALIKYATTHKQVEAVLVHKVDRLARDTYQYLTIRATLKRAGVRIISFTEHFDEGPLGALLENIMAAMSEFYSANLSMEVKKAINERLARGEWPGGSPPLGYLLEHGHLVPDPARAENVAWAFVRWSEGSITTTELAEVVYRRGLVNRRGKKIPAKQWCAILRRRVYTGHLTTPEGVVQGRHPVLVDSETFALVQARFSLEERHRLRPRRHRFLLTCLLVCPICGRHLVGEEHRRARTDTVYRYYRCHTKAHRIVKAETIETSVLDRLGVSPGKRAEDMKDAVARLARVVFAGDDIVLHFKPTPIVASSRSPQVASPILRTSQT